MRKIALSLSLAAAFAAPSLQAQIADVTLQGAGCVTPEGTPTMNHNGVPALGGNFDLFYTGPNHVLDHTQSSSQPILAIGFGVIGPFPIPQGLFFQQPLGCDLWNTHDIVIEMTPDQNGRQTYTNLVNIPITNDPALAGITFFAQWLVPHIQCGFAGCGPLPDWIATSGVAICTIGT